ncbi:HAD-IC family P-type ATPase [Actinobaculum suis]|uniref:HAD-IC family P-type ATPase n=1 Tax=Actinobaculum suis TaxID=1657 RepID=UPI00080875E3|nr:HAD-IC family P-type ATPase [Actinobaculum suis]OCA95119.1 magnesium-transporting ATPase [Actinobaculum suis]OCA95585.1 magnesium-transporting ATPase [Actinobaculum suis]
MTFEDPTLNNEDVPRADPAFGLTEKQAAELHAAGRYNALPARSGRTTWEIIRDNVFTRINFMLGVLFVLVMLTGSWINGAFGLLIFFNSIIGIVQELRAKRTLDKLAVVGEARPRIRREGSSREVSPESIVLGDIIEVRPGDQIVVDGEVTESSYLEIDESLLTGESDPIHKAPGMPVMSGSFVASGSGTYRATRIGADAYAAKLTSEASRFSLVDSQLQSGINSILKAITWILIPVGILTIVGQVRAGSGDWREIILSVTGALVPMIPEGLVLITSTAFALGVIRLGRLRVLVNELPAIEGLARVDTVAADKTGTLTENKLTFEGVELIPPAAAAAGTENSGTPVLAEPGETPLASAETPPAAAEKQVREILAQLGAADTSPNSSMEAIIEGVGTPAETWQVLGQQPFTSAKKWSGVSFAPGRNYVLGAPDVLLDLAPEAEAAKQRVADISATGQRVLLLGQATQPVTAAEAPGVVTPLAFILLGQKIRPDAGDTLKFFESQGVEVKVISGDNAQAVGAVTRNLGVDLGEPVDARQIPEADFDSVINENQVFGRVTPEQKRGMVKAMQGAGHRVAMTGDGVNDVLAMKDSDLGIGMGSGTSATRSVAKIVLLNDKFSSLPYVLAEGRRVVGNIERVARLFLTKTTYSALLAILVLIWGLQYPFQPIHVTITGWFTIGIPAFVLSLPPNNNKAQDGFVKRVMSFGFPVGIIVGIVTFATYLILGGNRGIDGPLATQVSTATLLAMIIASSWVLVVVTRPYNWWKTLLILLPAIGYGIIFSWDFTQEIFLLDSSNAAAMGVGAVAGIIGAACIEALWWVVTLRSGQRPRIFESDAERENRRLQAELRRKATHS